MTALTTHELAKAINQGSFSRMKNGLFQIAFPGSFGGEIAREASPAMLRGMISEACALARDDEKEFKEFLNGLMPEGFDPAVHAYGRVIDSREVKVLAASLFGDGPEYIKQREVLVEVSEDVDFFSVSEWVNPTQPKNRLLPGDVVWVSDDRLRNFELV